MLIKHLVKTILGSLDLVRKKIALVPLKNQTWDKPFGSPVRFLDYTVKITDGPNFMVQYKDEFINKVYDFETDRKSPLVIDGGSNIGMSILYCKRTHPDARIIGFEPDPRIFSLLQENVLQNGLSGVKLINAGLGAERGTLQFVPDSGSGGQVGDSNASVAVSIVPLSDYLDEEVDFLKLNIEGLELEVLEEAEKSGRLQNVRQIVLEYHGWAEEKQQLGAILLLLNRNDFRYLVHDFDPETCAASKPPFRLTGKTTWFCLVYAKKGSRQ